MAPLAFGEHYKLWLTTTLCRFMLFPFCYVPIFSSAPRFRETLVWVNVCLPLKTGCSRPITLATCSLRYPLMKTHSTSAASDTRREWPSPTKIPSHIACSGMGTTACLYDMSCGKFPHENYLHDPAVIWNLSVTCKLMDSILRQRHAMRQYSRMH
jgi:hypothetical protein